jgi:hypothetical protein
LLRQWSFHRWDPWLPLLILSSQGVFLDCWSGDFMISVVTSCRANRKSSLLYNDSELLPF